MKSWIRKLAFCLVTVLALFSTAMPVLAEEASAPEPYAYVGVEDGHFYSFYPTSSPGYFLNINNNSSGTALIRDRVILYPNAYNEDQVWKVTKSSNGNWYLRSSLNPSLALNINHTGNVCNLYPPENNYTYDGNGVKRSDSDLLIALAIKLIDWNMYLTAPYQNQVCQTYWSASDQIVWSFNQIR